MWWSVIDTKPRKRIKDPELLRRMHLMWFECALCGSTGRLSLHHINKHPRDDVQENLVMVCGSGTTGCHGLIESHDEPTLRKLGEYILRSRGDTIMYLYEYLGPVAATEWMHTHFMVSGYDE